MPVQADAPENATRLLYFSSYPEIVQPDDEAGLAELATAVTEQKRLHPDAYFIYGGASLGPSVLGALDSGAHMVDILNAMQPEFMAVGKKEFAYGYDELVVNALASAFPFVSSNLVDRQTENLIDGTDPYFLLEGINLKVGFIALTSVNAISEYGANEALARDETTAVRQWAQELRDMEADAIFLLADTDYDDLSEYRKNGIVDGIFYTHNFGNPYSLDLQGALYEEGPLDGKLIAVDLWLDDATNTLKSETSFIDIATYAPTKLISSLIQSYRNRLKERLSPPIAEIGTSFNTLRENVRTRENGFGNFVADALGSFVEADAVLLNSGSIRGNREYKAGNTLNRGDIQRELPFSNRIVLLNVKGRILREALEYGLECAAHADGCALQVSNLTVTYDSTLPAGARIQEIKVGPERLDEEHYYRVAMSDFMAAGNDGYEMFANEERVSIRGSNRAMWDLVAEYTERQRMIVPVLEGRLIDTNGATNE
ncbi:bifunctional metallophosphatase/5'-nucleotidase [Kordiimonas sp.]|uniref:bifunctional metallophosphatase/5'-nucleotidase n=1 Tax=Kordiimonas sp. TaxID=1970157 RepID=UPI003A8EAC4D